MSNYMTPDPIPVLLFRRDYVIPNDTIASGELNLLICYFLLRYS